MATPNDNVLDYANPMHLPPPRRTPWVWWMVGCFLLFLLGISVLLPQMGKPSERVNRVKCAANLRLIGQAIVLYASDHGGTYPPDLGTAIVTYDCGAECLICPSSNDDVARGPTTAAILAELAKPRHCSYTYVGQNLTAAAGPNAVVAYEPLSNHSNKGMNVLYNDGRVKWLDAAAAQKLMAELNAGYNPPRASKVK